MKVSAAMVTLPANSYVAGTSALLLVRKGVKLFVLYLTYLYKARHQIYVTTSYSHVHNNLYRLKVL